MDKPEHAEPALVVRRAEPGDARSLAEVHVASWKAAFPGLLPQDYLDALRPEDRLAQWEQDLAGDRWPAVLVAEEEGGIVGFVAVAPSEDPDAGPGRVGELRTIYLRPESWGHGHGEVLLRAAMGELAAGGFHRATLWVLNSNSRARRFYERHGWSADGATKEHDWQAFVATDVRYARPLPAGAGPASQAKVNEKP